MASPKLQNENDPGFSGFCCLPRVGMWFVKGPEVCMATIAGTSANTDLAGYSA